MDWHSRKVLSGQFTSLDFTQTLKDAGVRISMDGKGRWMEMYNRKRPHSSLDDKTPYEAYFGLPRSGYPALKAA